MEVRGADEDTAHADSGQCSPLHKQCIVIVICIMDMRLHMGSCMLVCGPHTSGKTVFILKLIDHRRELFDTPPEKVFWCYGHRTALHDQLTSRNYNMIHGIPDNFNFVTKNSLVMLDDLMVESANNLVVTQLFIRGAHHVPCFVICTTQQLFPPGT